MFRDMITRVLAEVDATEKTSRERQSGPGVGRAEPTGARPEAPETATAAATGTGASTPAPDIDEAVGIRRNRRCGDVLRYLNTAADRGRGRTHADHNAARACE